MDETPRKLCPFTLNFGLPVKSPVVGGNGSGRGEIRMGLPCAGQKCMWWDQATQDCVIFSLVASLDALAHQ